jgi:predicted RNase H-like nuclease
MAPVAGVDGVPGGWVVASVDDGKVRWEVVATAADVLAATGNRAAVGLDIPLGLPRDTRRACDDLTAQRLGNARSSVFPAPPRPVVGADGYERACAVAQQLTGRKISMQTFHILPKIAQWDAVEPPATVLEAHPELSFRTLAPDIAFEPKRTVRGSGQRIAALARWIDIGPALADLPAGAALNDLLDALAVAWTAERWTRGEAETLGGDLDERGRVMRVVH